MAEWKQSHEARKIEEMPVRRSGTWALLEPPGTSITFIPLLARNPSRPTAAGLTSFTEMGRDLGRE